MLSSIKSFIYVVSIAVIPMAFGSFLFVGIIESYKNNESLNSVIVDSYKSIRSQRAQCHKIHNDLYMAYYPYAGSLKIIKKELGTLIDTKGIGLTKEHEIFMLSLYESNSKQLKEIQKLKVLKDDCYTTLYMKYEETAILVNLLDDYEGIASARATEINNLNASIKEATKKLSSVTENDILNVFQTGVESALVSNKDKWLLGMEELADSQIELAKIEEKVFSIEFKTFGKLRRIYLGAIKNRLNSGFVDYLVR